MATAEAAATGLRRDARRRVIVRYASFESRVAAAVLDALVALIIAALCISAGSLVVLFSSDFERVDPSDTALYTFWGFAGSILPVILLYFFVGYTWKGQTIGTSVMQTMVIRSDGKPLGVVGAAARVVGLLVYPLVLAAGGIAGYALDGRPWIAAASVGAAVVLVIAGILWAALDRHRRMLHDRIAGTIVVKID